MEIHLTREREAQITAMAAAQGRTVDDVLTQAVGEWAERQIALTEIRATLDAADAECAAGGGQDITAENQRAVMDMIKRDGRALAAMRSQRPALA